MTYSDEFCLVGPLGGWFSVRKHTRSSVARIIKGRLVAVERWTALAADCRYSAKELARVQRISVRQLERDFHETLGTSPQRWLDLQRLNVAKGLLLSGTPVKRVAWDLAYGHTSHFSRHFKALTGITPTEFLRQCLTDDVAAR